MIKEGKDNSSNEKETLLRALTDAENNLATIRNKKQTFNNEVKLMTNKVKDGEREVQVRENEN